MRRAEQPSGCTPLSTPQRRVSVGSTGFTEEPFPLFCQVRDASKWKKESQKAEMVPASHHSLSLLCIGKRCPKQHNCSIHLCPQHRNKFYCSAGLQYRWVHILYGSSAFCYRPKAEFQQTAALLSRVSCCLMEAESLLFLPCRATYSAAECSHIH